MTLVVGIKWRRSKEKTAEKYLEKIEGSWNEQTKIRKMAINQLSTFLIIFPWFKFILFEILNLKKFYKQASNCNDLQKEYSVKLIKTNFDSLTSINKLNYKSNI